MLEYRMSQNFGRVLISTLCDRNVRVEVRDEQMYMEQHKIRNKNQGGLCELVGLKEYQVKPYFDLDPKGEFDYSIIETICEDIQSIHNAEVYVGGRDAREETNHRGNMVLKHSRRIYLKARISYFNIPIVFKEIFEKYDCVDKGVYDRNRVLFAPLSDRKRDLDVPVLKNLKGSIFDCCATYIQEDYEDLDALVQAIEEPKTSLKNYVKPIDEDIKDEDDVNDNDKYTKLQKLINKLSENRSSNFDTWINVNWCLINICKKEGISSTKMNRLIHQFSKLSKSNYDEDKVDEWIDKNIDRVREKTKKEKKFTSKNDL